MSLNDEIKKSFEAEKKISPVEAKVNEIKERCENMLRKCGLFKTTFNDISYSDQKPVHMYPFIEWCEREGFRVHREMNWGVWDVTVSLK